MAEFGWLFDWVWLVGLFEFAKSNLFNRVDFIGAAVELSPIIGGAYGDFTEAQDTKNKDTISGKTNFFIYFLLSSLIG